MRSCFLLPALLIAATVSAQTKEPLWPKGAPDAKGMEAKDIPQLIVHVPEKDQAVRSAIVICPGGGYGGLAMDHEGKQIAQWLNENGIAAFICDYRHRGKGYGHPAPLQDAQRAIRTVRARAEEFNLDANKIGILGFSAGGHLASTAATHFAAGKPDADDPIEKVSCRPDFAVLCYAVIAFNQPFTHRGSQKNLLGENPDPELVKSLSNELQVTSETPPTFLWHTYEDTGVPPDNSLAFYSALVKNKVPGELHIYEKGRHGIGLAKGIVGTERWPDDCIAWLVNRGMAKKK